MQTDAGQRELGISDLAARLEQLEKRIEHLEDRLHAHHPHTSGLQRAAVPAVEPLDEEKDLALLGGALIGIGGGFLLRALTEAHLLPTLAGVALGIAYAFGWLWFADRHARRGLPHAATFDAVVMAFVVFPLSWEVSIRFAVIPAIMALFVVVLSASALLFVGWRRNVASFAWIASLAVIPSAAALALGDARASIPLISVTLLGSAIWWISRTKKWTGADLPLALGIGVMAIVAAAAASEHHGRESAAVVAIAICVSFLFFTGTAVARTLRTGTDLTRYDIVSIAPAALAMVTGASFLASRESSARTVVPLLFALAAVAAYAVSWRRRSQVPVAAAAFSIFGFICALASSAVILTPAAAGVVWAILAAGFAVTAVPQLLLHSAGYAFMAIAASGLLTKCLTLISGIGGSARLHSVDVATMVVVIGAAIVALTRRGRAETRLANASRLALLAMTVFVAAAGAARVIVAIAATDPASSATARSAAIAASAVALVFIARLRPFRELSLLVYPLLCVGAAKFITDDFMGGRAATLFATLAIYGVALLIVAKFRRAHAGTSATA